MWINPLFFGGEHDLTKCELIQFSKIDLKVKPYDWHEVLMCETYFSCESVHCFFGGEHNLTKSCKSNYSYSFLRPWLQILKIRSAWSVDYVTYLFHVDQSIIFWRGAWFNKIFFYSFEDIYLNIYLRHMFGMKCWCAWHIFQFFGGVHDFTKSCDGNYFYSFKDSDLKLNTCLAWSVDVCHIFFMWISCVHYYFEGSSIIQNLMMQITSIFCKIITWKYMFIMKCRYEIDIWPLD
jgi:hypothetical protein